MAGQNDQIQILVTRLYEAALTNNVPSLLTILLQDPRILDRCNNNFYTVPYCLFIQSPLHIASSFGHLAFVAEILLINPKLAQKVDFMQRWSPLHVSAANGHMEVVRALLGVNVDVCLLGDQDGRNPIHVAVMNGHVGVLQVLLLANPLAAREQTRTGETGLHLCVKHAQLEAARLFVDVMDDVDLFNLKDNNGNTVLHLAVIARQSEMVDILLKSEYLDRNAINTNNMTAMEICQQGIEKDKGNNIRREIWMEIRRSLRNAYALNTETLKTQENERWFEDQRNGLMVVASVVATMAFQVVVSPPGGTWQDNTEEHRAGNSIMADENVKEYETLLAFSGVAFVMSLMLIMLLSSGLPNSRFFLGLYFPLMWTAIWATTRNFLIAVDFISGKTESWYIKRDVKGWFGLWWGFMVCYLIVKAINWFRYTFKGIFETKIGLKLSSLVGFSLVSL